MYTHCNPAKGEENTIRGEKCQVYFTVCRLLKWPPSLCCGGELTGPVNKECVPGRVALWSPRFQMKMLLIWNTLDTYGKLRLCCWKWKMRRDCSIWSHPFDRFAIKVFCTEWKCRDRWICVFLSFFFQVAFWFVIRWNSCVLSPPISVINWSSREKVRVNKCTSKMIM